MPTFGRRSLLAGSLAAATVPILGCLQSSIRRPSTWPAPESEVVAFSDRFRFGLATSAYQVEGSTKADGRGTSIWDTFCRQSGTIDDGSSGEMPCDHYRRWESDLDLLAQLGDESYWFSIAGCGSPSRRDLAAPPGLVRGGARLPSAMGTGQGGL